MPKRGISLSDLRGAGLDGMSVGPVYNASGRYQLGIATNTGQSSFGQSQIDRLWASPFVVTSSFSIDRVAIHVNTLQASSNMRFGIYESGSDGLPGDLVVDAGAVDTSTTGVKAQTVDEVLFGPRVYWGAVIQDTANVGIYGRAVAYSLGNTSTFNIPHEVVYKTMTYGALPDPYVADAFLSLAGTPGQFIFVRAT